MSAKNSTTFRVRPRREGVVWANASFNEQRPTQECLADDWAVFGAAAKCDIGLVWSEHCYVGEVDRRFILENGNVSLGEHGMVEGEESSGQMLKIVIG